MTTTTPRSASQQRDGWRQALNVVLAIAQVLAIYIAVTLNPSGGLNERSGTEPPIVPAFYVFFIWGLIYAGSLAYALYQALPRHRNNDLLRQIGWWTAGAFAATTLWAVMFGLGWLWLTVVCMFTMLITLLGAFIQCIRYRAPRSMAERVFVVLPISIFTGYITVAAIANTASVLSAYGISIGLSEQTWAVVMLIAAGVIGSFATLVSRGNVGYALTIIWALIGIVVANLSPQPNTAVAVVAGSMAVLVAIALLRAQASVRHLKLH